MAIPQVAHHPQIQQLPPTQRPQFFKTAEQIAQMAIRLLFVSTSILMAAYVAPLAVHTFIVTTVALGSACLSGFFFPSPKPYLGGFAQAPQRVPEPLPLPGHGPVQMPEGAPRGLMNTGNNCFLNSLVHLFDADPQLAAWLRTPLNDLESFIDFMNDYPQPPNFMNQFRVYIAQRQAQAEAQPQAEQEQAGAQPPVVHMPSVVNQFRDFINQYAIDPEHARVFNNLSDSFDAVYKIQIPFSKFLREYDNAIENNLPMSQGNSQALRHALINFKPWLPHGNIQMDASEIMGFILEVLPRRMDMQIEVTKNLRNPYGADRAPINTPPIVTIGPKIELTIPDGNGPIALADVFNSWYLERTEHEPVRRLGEDGVQRNYPIQSCSNKFLAPPPALRISLKRFVAPPSSLMTSVCSYFWPALQYVKRDTPVDAPEIFTIRTNNGQEHQYRLVSYVTHLGMSRESGHYVSGEIKNGQKYLESDSRVRHVQTDAHRAEWKEQLRGAYLLNYVPIPEDQVPVQ